MSRTMGKLNTGIPQVPIVPVGVDPEIAADRQGLPIFAHRTEIIQTINQNQVKYFFCLRQFCFLFCGISVYWGLLMFLL
jgi:hypothetical protein